ncbi:MAG: hypothetical protein OXN89_03440 [Bryobacterales bacterium]|nr:hypothetical protein [Bryobacterales bacterium]
MRLRARLPVSLTTQSCVDSNVILTTRDRDVRHSSALLGLLLALGAIATSLFRSRHQHPNGKGHGVESGGIDQENIRPAEQTGLSYATSPRRAGTIARRVGWELIARALPERSRGFVNPVWFDIDRVNRLRRDAVRAGKTPYEQSDLSPTGDGFGDLGSWRVSTYDACDLIAVFDTLHLRKGFVLHTYRLWAGGDGNGVIWALRADAPRLAAEQCSSVEGTDVPKPPRAVALMQVIEGDGSPWSYLSASILRREAAEFGASWHGVDWGAHDILGKAPRQAQDRDTLEDGSVGLGDDGPVDEWTLHSAPPRKGEPAYLERGTTKEVVLHLHTGLGRSRVFRATDRYFDGSYDCKATHTDLCTGVAGYIF